MSDVAQMERVMKHAWLEPKARAQLEAPFPWPGTDAEDIDFDWWEPRHDQPWRRQVARDRAEFGGVYVARPKPPLEGPNNPNRLRRELEDAQDRLEAAIAAEEEAEEVIADTQFEVASLRVRLEDIGHA